MPLYTFNGIKLPRIDSSVQLGYGNSIDRYIAGLSGFPSDISPDNVLRAQTSIYNLNGIYNDEVLDVVNQIVGWDDFNNAPTHTENNPDFFKRLDDYRNPYSGRDTFGVKLSGNQTGTINAPRQNRIPCTAGERYRFSFWAKGERCKFNLGVKYQLSIGGEQTETYAFETDLVQDRWQKFFLDFIPVTNALMYEFGWKFVADSDCVIDLPEAGIFGRDAFINECIDPNFEYGKDGFWRAISGGISDQDDGILFSDENGSNPYRFSSPTRLNGIEIEYFKKYYIGFRLKTFRTPIAHATARLTPHVQFFDGSGTSLGDNLNETIVSVPSGLKLPRPVEFGKIIQPPNGAKYIQIVFVPLNGHENETYHFEIGNVSVNPIIDNGILNSKRQRDMINALHGFSGVLTRIEKDEINWIRAHMKLNDYDSNNQVIFSGTDNVNLNFQTEGKNWRSIGSTIISGDFSDLKHHFVNNGLEALSGAILKLNLSSADDQGGTASVSFKMGGNSWKISNIPAFQSPQIVVNSYNETVHQIIGGVASNKWGDFAFKSDHQTKRMVIVPSGPIEIEFEIEHIDTASTFTLEFFKEFP